MYLRESDLLIVPTKDECLAYLRDLKRKNPDYIYSSKDKLFIEKLSKEFKRSKSSVIQYLQSLNNLAPFISPCKYFFNFVLKSSFMSIFFSSSILKQIPPKT